MLDYQNVANVLLPLVGATYALHFMGESMMDMYHKFEADRCERVWEGVDVWVVVGGMYRKFSRG